ncbi:DUF3493 domain-containing protein [Prochlorococcus sp. MIT 1307]|uniref:DUF3493 domain-containing protein n=1 Tax=Prochlorococcus sp. MIT 1307 TaxID=3096219 RepID=UPI002A7656EE|nr:DUF3493 domain-containing protein [Prochlorococcus sp. MIT 1307]
MTENSGSSSKLNNELRDKLLKESRTPFRGLRRGIWLALLGSSCIGIFVMTFRALSGQTVLLSDAGIQICALLLFSGLLYLDRPSSN